jgi:hypothetical protein
MAVYGAVGEFMGGNEDVKAYLERFDFFLEGNDITEENKKKSIFLATVGATTYKLLRSLCNNDPKGKTFAQLCTLLQDHLSPCPNVIAHRFKFFKRDRMSSESMSQYLAELRKLSEHCEFQDKLDEQLRDKFTCGCNNEKIQHKLLTIKDLSLKSAFDHAIAIESAYRDTKEIHGQSSKDLDLNQMSSKRDSRDSRDWPRDSRDSRECFRCGDKRHFANKCPLKSKECFKCGKIGHTAQVCRSDIDKRSDGEKSKICQVSSSEVEDRAGIDLLGQKLSFSQLPGPIKTPKM